MTYALKLSDAEIFRYRKMAEMALEAERDEWAAVGIVPGAKVADIGSGPGAITAALSDLVGPSGRVWAVDRDPEAIATARVVAPAPNVEFRTGTATETGLEPGCADVVMMRHVLAHNGGDEQAIVDHLATLARPGGGAVYLLDIDGAGLRIRPGMPEFEELDEAYRELHRRRGNDLQVGLRLEELLVAAGLEPVLFRGIYQIVKTVPGMRPPSWAARDALLAEGLVTQDDLDRWNTAFERLDEEGISLTVFAAQLMAAGRRP
ncbi:methyltransferase domain-containing protein [Streptosporangiaceae bacterium NEAU-GS5]|nr:methyltransferase domain-containing protein [Streptosporangiaceae bacterium NEAU-GS5]